MIDVVEFSVYQDMRVSPLPQFMNCAVRTDEGQIDRLRIIILPRLCLSLSPHIYDKKSGFDLTRMFKNIRGFLQLTFHASFM